jgi:diguanylate cyclase (GGDEF)-like protein
VVISNTAGAHPASRGTPQGHPRISRFLGLPIKVKDRVVGFIGLANKFSPYTNEDAEFFQPLLDALAGLFYAVDLEQARAEAEEKLRKLAMTDPLTGLFNRRAFIEQCEDMAKDHCSIFVVLIDIDHFKNVNDTYGHDAGDCALKQTADIISDAISDGDIVARLGGEEFAMVIRGECEREAKKRLDSLRKRIAATKMSYKKDTLQLTVSMGVTFVDDGFNMDFSALLSLADQALYDAKANGRDRIEWAPFTKKAV